MGEEARAGRPSSPCDAEAAMQNGPGGVEAPCLAAAGGAA